jgi:hypothetical protein
MIKIFGVIFLLILNALAFLMPISFSHTTKNSVYQITNCTQLQGMSQDLSGYYMLVNDIDCSDVLNFNPVGQIAPGFTGIFNGQNHTISNINEKKTLLPGKVGLFGITTNATITNVHLVNIIFPEKSGIEGGLVGYSDIGTVISNSSVISPTIGVAEIIGGLVGRNYGTIINCYATVFGNSSKNALYIGGLTGYNVGNILNSYSTGDINLADNTAAVGGLVGFNSGDISNSYSSFSMSWDNNFGAVGGLVGVVHSGGVSNSYAIGHAGGIVSGNAGGLIGLATASAKISDSYYDQDTSGQHDTGKGIPEPTAQMMQQSTFQNWDFADTWTINNGQSYPQFKTAPLSISFSQIPTQQQINIPIPVMITANDPHFSGRVYLSSSSGDVYPEYVDLTNGSASANITVYEVGMNNQLYMRWDDPANSGHTDAESNLFNVTKADGTIPNNAILIGQIVDVDDHPLPNVTVQLYSGDPNSGGTPIGSPATTDQNGNYTINNIPPGQFYLKASASNYQADVETIGLAPQRTITGNITLYPQNPKHLAALPTPVLLIPGIMGSTTKSFEFDPYPRLHKVAKSKELRLLDPSGVVGWGKLRSALESAGYHPYYSIFEMPYDWTLSQTAIRDQDLLPQIDYIKKLTGAKQIDIVAHSMGGLIVRSYLQSANFTSRKDVRKFAMIGTPNKGSDKAYYVWEGGDPIQADEAIEADTQGLGKYFYSNTLYFLLEKRGVGEACKFKGLLRDIAYWCNTNKIYDYAHDSVLSAGQLMPIYDNALQNVNTKDNVQIIFEENTLLRALNNLDCNNPKGCVDKQGNFYQFTPANQVMTPDGSGVETKLFAGTTYETLNVISVLPQPSNKFYKDGDPKGNFLTIAGDGTVLLNSVSLYFTLPLAAELENHGSLVKASIDDVMSFLTGSQYKSQKTNAPEPTQLVIEIDGRVQPTIANANSSQGAQLKLNPNDEQESFNLDSADLAIKNPSNGVYTVTLQSPYQENYTLKVFYVDADNNILQGAQVTGYYDATLKAFTFALNTSQPTNPFIFDRTFSTPTELNMQNSGNYVQLSWQDPTGDSNKDVDHYEIYWKTDVEPYYAYLGRTQQNEKQYMTNQPWSNAQNNLYMVRTILKNGTSTYFSNVEFIAD